LPELVDTTSLDRGSLAMTEAPFFREGAASFSVRGEGTRWEVDDIASGPSPSTIHRVFVRPACPAGTYGPSCAESCDCNGGLCDDGRDGSGACTCGARREGTRCEQCTFGWSGASCDVPAGPNTSPMRNCTEIHRVLPAAPSGSYLIDPDGPRFAFGVIEAYCDMTTEGGGWTLVLNYTHQAGTSPETARRFTTLPSLRGTELGLDEAGSTAWGHAATPLFEALDATEVRFFGISQAHPRVVHFKTSSPECLLYFGDGFGSCQGIESDFTELSGHSAFLPAAADSWSSNQRDAAMTARPFFRTGDYAFSAGGAGGLWEVDDIQRSGPVDTIQRVWVRSR
jgi:hypothetical protein